MAQPVLFNPSCTKIGTAASSKSQETRSLPRVKRTCREEREVKLSKMADEIHVQTLAHPASSTHQIGNTVQVTAHGEEDDGPLRVGETLRVQKEGHDGESGGEEAQHGPHGHPGVGEDFGAAPVQAAVIATLQRTAVAPPHPGVLVWR